jgi:N-methylhydantoinase B
MSLATGSPTPRTGTTDGLSFDPALLAVIANRLDAIVREMTSTLLRSGRSAVINVARDFSCSIVTADDELLSSAEGLPVHVFGSHLQTAEMRRVHPNLSEGDAFLDNDPYVGNTHHADHTILVPVFAGGEHVFTAVAKAHQADIGNALPTTYMPFAANIYEEGSISFPCVQVQRDDQDIDDVIRMCRRRIRVPDQWYGDYLATLGSARTGERRLKELIDKYGIDLLKQFVAEWFDYSERRMAHAISELPSGTVIGQGQHDTFGPFAR